MNEYRTQCVLQQWQDRCDIDSYLTEYYFIRMAPYILDDLYVAKRIESDIRSLKRLGFNGLFSCQVLRSFYPTAIGMTLMAAQLWDDEREAEDIIAEQLHDEFGPFAPDARQYLQCASNVLGGDESPHQHLMYHAN